VAQLEPIHEAQLLSHSGCRAVTGVC
jgi:hypothetical protein